MKAPGLNRNNEVIEKRFFQSLLFRAQRVLVRNGGILTASNLFATRFDQVVNLCEKRAKDVDYIMVGLSNIAPLLPQITTTRSRSAQRTGASLYANFLAPLGLLGLRVRISINGFGFKLQRVPLRHGGYPGAD